jgi:hypothetical protein
MIQIPKNNIGRNKAKEQKLGKYDVPQKPGINEICHEVYNPQSQLKIQRFLHLGGGGIHFRGTQDIADTM